MLNFQEVKQKNICWRNNWFAWILFFNNEISISIRVFQVEAGEPHTDSNCEHVRDLCSNLSSFILPDHELCGLTLR